PESTGESRLRPSSARRHGREAETVQGSIMGTPQYMSPEQVAGNSAALGPASDVYSLGATLYYLLTGRPPVNGDSIFDVLKNVSQGHFLRPRKVNRRIERALEAICLKAMAWRPEDRYASARDMGDDIEHWLG